MWLCTKFGFYSVVQKAKDEYHIRARSRQDLVNLIESVLESGVFMDQFPGGKMPTIHRSEPADYRWRIVCGHGQWIAFARELICNIDYANFKGVIASSNNQRSKLSIYSRFHHEMEEWQKESESRATDEEEPLMLWPPDDPVPPALKKGQKKSKVKAR